MVKRFGSDSPVVRMAATLYGSTETTFYVLAVYFGSVNIRKTRHALPAGLLADFAGTLLSVYVIRMLFHG
jgi:spore maturation protein B